MFYARIFIWFTSERLVKNEMKLVIQLYLDGKTKEEIRDLVIDEDESFPF